MRETLLQGLSQYLAHYYKIELPFSHFDTFHLVTYSNLDNV